MKDYSWKGLIQSIIEINFVGCNRVHQYIHIGFLGKAMLKSASIARVSPLSQDIYGKEPISFLLSLKEYK